MLSSEKHVSTFSELTMNSANPREFRFVVFVLLDEMRKGYQRMFIMEFLLQLRDTLRVMGALGMTRRTTLSVNVRVHRLFEDAVKWTSDFVFVFDRLPLSYSGVLVEVTMLLFREFNSLLFRIRSGLNEALRASLSGSMSGEALGELSVLGADYCDSCRYTVPRVRRRVGVSIIVFLGDLSFRCIPICSFSHSAMIIVEAGRVKDNLEEFRGVMQRSEEA